VRYLWRFRPAQHPHFNVTITMEVGAKPVASATSETSALSALNTHVQPAPPVPKRQAKDPSREKALT